MKKAISTIIFTWIFILFAGALILFFFIKFSYEHISTSTMVSTRQLVYGLDDQLNALSVSQESNRDIDIKDELNFDCNTISSLDYRKPTENIIFSPLTIKGYPIQAWTQKIAFPFEITTFFYLSNKKTAFYIDDFNIFQRIPNRFNKFYMPSLQQDKIIQDSKTLDQVNIVLTQLIPNPQALLSSIKSPKANLIYINKPNKELTFYSKDGSVTNSFYLIDGMIYGSIFSPENYDCLKDKFLEKLKKITKIYEQKAYYLSLKPSNCQQDYNIIQITLNNFQTLTEKYALIQQAQALESQNRRIEGNGCPKIY